MGIYLPGSLLYSTIFLLYSWGSLFGVPGKVPLTFELLPALAAIAKDEFRV